MILHLENSKNLGDNILQFNFNRRALIADESLQIVHYCNAGHIPQLEQFIDLPIRGRLQLKPYEEKPADAVDTWIAGNTFGPGFYWNHPLRPKYNEFYYDWFHRLAERLGIKCPILFKTDVAFKHPLFYNDDIIQDELEKYDGSPDILCIDCKPMSGQFNFDEQVWDSALNNWRVKGLKVISLKESKLSLAQIGALACNVKNVVAVCTGPLHVAFNSRSLAIPDTHWHVFHQAHTYTYAKNTWHHTDNRALFSIQIR